MRRGADTASRRTHVLAAPLRMSASPDRRAALAQAAGGALAALAALARAGAAGAAEAGARRDSSRGYERGKPIPTEREQRLWGTRLGQFTEEADGLDDLRRDLVAMLAADQTLGPSLVRLSFHASGTYDRLARTGGSARGTLRFPAELAHEANAGLEKVLPALEPLKRKYPAVSYADLYTLAGAVSVEALGGPHIQWRAGRVDSVDPKDAAPDGLLPDADRDLRPGATRRTMGHLRQVFGRMGFSDQELVALSGAHNLGKCHYEDSGYEGVWSETPWKFDNSYFNILLQPVAMPREGDPYWVPETLPNGRVQYVDANRVYIMLPSDLALLADPKTAEWVRAYARNSPLFFRDFAAAYSKLLALGT